MTGFCGQIRSNSLNAIFSNTESVYGLDHFKTNKCNVPHLTSPGPAKCLKLPFSLWPVVASVPSLPLQPGAPADVW